MAVAATPVDGSTHRERLIQCLFQLDKVIIPSIDVDRAVLPSDLAQIESEGASSYILKSNLNIVDWRQTFTPTPKHVPLTNI